MAILARSVDLFRKSLLDDLHLSAEEQKQILEAAGTEGDSDYSTFLVHLFDSFDIDPASKKGEAPFIITTEEGAQLSRFLESRYGSAERVPQKVRQIVDTLFCLQDTYQIFSEHYKPKNFRLPLFFQNDLLEKFQAGTEETKDFNDYFEGLFRWVYSSEESVPRALQQEEIEAVQADFKSDKAVVNLTAKKVSYELHLTGRWEDSYVIVCAGHFRKTIKASFEVLQFIGTSLIRWSRKTGGYEVTSRVLDLMEPMLLRQPQEGEAEEKVDFRNQKHNVNTYSEIIDEAQRIKKAGPKKELEVNDQITIPYYSKYPLPQDFIVRFREAFIKDNLSVAYQATRPFVFLSVSEVDVLIDRYQRKHQLSEEDLTVGLPMANVYRTSSDHPEYNFQVILITYDDQKGVLYANRSALTHEQNHALEDELFPGLYFVFPQRKTGKRKYVGRSLSEDEEFYGIKKHWEKLKETRSFATYWQLTAPDEYFAELIRGMRGAIEPVGIEAGPIDRKEIFEKDPVGYLTASLFLETGLKFSFLKEMFQEAGLFIEAQSPLIAERREVLEKEWLVYAAKKMPEIVLEKMNQIAEQQSKTKTGNFREEEIVARMEYIEMAVYVKKQRALSPDILENVTKYLGDIRVGTSHITFEKIQRELEKAGWRI